MGAKLTRGRLVISALLSMPKPLTVWITINCGKFWERWEYQTTLICHLRNLYAGQEATVRMRHGTTNLFQTGKGVHQGYILSPCLFNLYAEYIMQNARLDEAEAGVKVAYCYPGYLTYIQSISCEMLDCMKLESGFPGEISITSDMQMTPPLWQKVKRN